ncbi:MAG: GDP-mannose 4,6-dehydratase [Roseibacillus sp.]
MKHILVTGGAGFIGSHTCEALLARGDRVTIIDNFDPFYDRTIKERNLSQARTSPHFSMIEGDINDTSIYEQLKGKGIDVIVHLAAKAGVRPSIEDPLGYERTNVQATIKLLQFAVSEDIKHFVFASSSSVYGENPNHPWKENEPDLKPISPYAATKLAGEGMGHVFSHLYGIRFTALRFFTVFGPRQRPDLAINKFTRLISAGEKIPFFGDGSSSRDYTYIDDIVSGVLKAVDYRAKKFEVFNLGNDQTVSLQEMVDVIAETLELPAKIDSLPKQPGDVPITAASIEHSKSELGYQPAVSFKEGIERFVDWSKTRIEVDEKS